MDKTKLRFCLESAKYTERFTCRVKLHLVAGEGSQSADAINQLNLILEQHICNGGSNIKAEVCSLIRVCRRMQLL